jgi:hypothetical protein
MTTKRKLTEAQLFGYASIDAMLKKVIESVDFLARQGAVKPHFVIQLSRIRDEIAAEKNDRLGDND